VPLVAETNFYSAETLKKWLPEWALAPVPTKVEGPLIQLRRVVESREPSTVSTLRMALDETKGSVEIGDEGPFLINDLRIPGDARVIRARPGFRPIIRIERPTLDAVRSLPGVIVLEGKNVILDSLDIIVNLRDLSSAQTAFFCCKGASLTVRNCSITLVGQSSQPFSLIRAEGSVSRGSRIRFERTLLRGSVSSGFDLLGGTVDVVVRSSVFMGSQGPIVRVLNQDRTSDHRFSVVGSVLACRGPGFEIANPKPGKEPGLKPLVIRSFDTAFGRFQGAGIASVVAFDNAIASPRGCVDWFGQQNLFCGWRGFLASGEDRSIQVPNLAALRSTWNGSDLSSQEIPTAWPMPARLGQSVPQELSPFVPGREAALGQVALPRAFLGAKTFWSFPSPILPVPSVFTASSTPNALSTAVARFNTKEGLGRSDGLTYNPAPTAHSEPTTGSSIVDLLFDTDAPQWHGDLGYFLREKMAESAKHARVRVRGSGPRRCSPVRLPDGLVLEIRIEPPVNGDTEWLSWSPEAEAEGRALLELHGGTLVLSQLRLRADESAAIESLIHVEEGNLVLHRCQLTAPPGSEARTNRLVSFVAATTRPGGRESGTAVFAAEPDRPVCTLAQSVLITNGKAMRVEIGRGLVSLTQCALASGGDAIELLPARVACSRFDADVWLDHCSLASESNIIRFGPWLGHEPGPDRPWLITSTNCAFLGTYDRRVSETVLLRADEEALAHGSVFWQGTGDAMEIDAFTAVGREPPINRPRDVLYQWINFWGNNHVREVTGPRTGYNQPSVRLYERLHPGRIEPADLILDPDYHPGRGRLDVGADLSLQGIDRRPPLGGRRR
jgi:serine/threonine-protein kinase